jgi:hypothetical protein
MKNGMSVAHCLWRYHTLTAVPAFRRDVPYRFVERTLIVGIRVESGMPRQWYNQADQVLSIQLLQRREHPLLHRHGNL